MDKMELEFLKLKETEGFQQNYPHLYNEKLGIGTKTNISIIAKKIKRGFFVERPELDWVLQQVFEDCKKVSTQYNKRFKIRFYYRELLVKRL